MNKYLKNLNKKKLQPVAMSNLKKTETNTNFNINKVCGETN